VQQRLVTFGFEPARATPNELAALIKSEIPKWAGVIRAANIKPE
jgi:tripartite-type tricarboxylate transporter receptor subunit TctC